MDNFIELNEGVFLNLNNCDYFEIHQSYYNGSYTAKYHVEFSFGSKFLKSVSFDSHKTALEWVNNTVLNKKLTDLN